MGICAKTPQEKQNIISTKAIFKTNSFDKMQFYFTTENLLRIDADCLVIYCDEKMNLHKNTFVANVGKLETRKIKEFAEAHLMTSKALILPGQIVFFPISIATLQFRFIGMVCLKTWESHQLVESDLRLTMTNLFKDLNRHHVQSLAITEFNQQFGIPTQIACKLLSETLYESRDWLRLVTIICNSTITQNFYMQKIVQFARAPHISGNLSDATSMYY